MGNWKLGRDVIICLQHLLLHLRFWAFCFWVALPCLALIFWWVFDVWLRAYMWGWLFTLHQFSSDEEEREEKGRIKLWLYSILFQLSNDESAHVCTVLYCNVTVAA